MKRNGFIATTAATLGLLLALSPAASLAGERSHGGHSYSGGHRSYSGHYSGGHRYRSNHYRGHHGYGYSRHGYRSSYRHHGRGGSGWVPFAILGGAALGYVVAESNNNNYRESRSYNNQPYNTGASRNGSGWAKPCHVVHKVTEGDGEQVKMAATMCYDEQGTSYIVKGSEHVIARLN